METVGFQRAFGKESCKELSLKLSYPTETVYADSLSNSLSGYVTSSLQKSSLSVEMKVTNQHLQKISCPSSTYTPVERWEEDRIHTRHLRISVSRETRWILEMWSGHCRRVYNDTSERLCERNLNGLVKFLDNEITDKIRKDLINKDPGEEVTLKSIQCKDVPKEVRYSAFGDAVSNYKTNVTLFNKERLESSLKVNVLRNLENLHLYLL